MIVSSFLRTTSWPSSKKENDVSEPETKKRGLPPDIQTLAKIDRLMQPLDDDECIRIVEWLHDKYVIPMVERGCVRNPPKKDGDR